MHRSIQRWFSIPLVLGGLLAAGGAGAADVKERAIKLSYVTAKDSPYGLGVAKFADLVAQKSEGKIKVRGYSDGQLGAEVQSISSAQGGVLEMSLVSTAAATGNVKEFALFDFPFLFSEEKEAYAVLDGPVGTQLLDKLTDRGVVGLCYWEVGFRHVTNSKHPVLKLEDFQGLKIRTIQNPVFVDVFNTLGANASPMAFTEVYTALVNGCQEPRLFGGEGADSHPVYFGRGVRDGTGAPVSFSPAWPPGGRPGWRRPCPRRAGRRGMRLATGGTEAGDTRVGVLLFAAP